MRNEDGAKETLPDDLEHQLIKKAMQAGLEVGKAWIRYESYTVEFHTVYEQNLAFLALEPRTNVPFPPWLQQLHIAYKAEALH